MCSFFRADYNFLPLSEQFFRYILPNMWTDILLVSSAIFFPLDKRDMSSGAQLFTLAATLLTPLWRASPSYQLLGPSVTIFSTPSLLWNIDIKNNKDTPVNIMIAQLIMSEKSIVQQHRQKLNRAIYYPERHLNVQSS